jgi:hypothetical protein
MSARTFILLAAVVAVAAVVGIEAASSSAAPAKFRTVAASNGAGVGFYSTGHVSCPSGYRVIGGGYQAGRRVNVTGSWPENGTTWAVRGASTGSSPLTYTIYARCELL